MPFRRKGGKKCKRSRNTSEDSDSAHSRKRTRLERRLPSTLTFPAMTDSESDKGAGTTRRHQVLIWRESSGWTAETRFGTNKK